MISTDRGRSWQGPEILVDDLGGPDLGYPRAVRMDDDRVLAVYYTHRGGTSERYIEALRWKP